MMKKYHYYNFAAQCALLALVIAAVGIAQSTQKVWVNIRSGVYHCPGSEHFGKTARGEFVEERTAIRNGYRPNGGKKCAATSEKANVRESAQIPTTSPIASRNDAPRAPNSVLRPCRLEKIVDADTIECFGMGKVRLIGIDAPELGQRPFGTLAADALARLAPINSEIVLEADRSPKDRYGRVLAYAWLNGRMLNWQLVRDGWALSYRYPPDVKYSLLLDGAQRSAQIENRGLWKIGAFGCTPANHRRGDCQ